MGLTIKHYNYSYSCLHLLRQKALEYEGISIPIRDFYDQNKVTTRFREFIIHSDCEGIYVSKSSKLYYVRKEKILKSYGTLHCYMGDLDILKSEVKELNDFMHKNLSWTLLNAWCDFYKDVMSARKILEFR